jgi:serine/threonine-protein kinase
LLIILLIVLAVVASFFAWWWFAGPGSYWTVPESVDKPCTQTVCSLTGADYKEYQETLKNLGIPYKATQVFDDDIEKGKIVSADPDVNGHVSRRGGVLQLKVSKGIEMVTIPADFLTCAPQSQQSPEETLLAAHFTNITVNEKYDLTPQGCAISIDPKPGATIPHNQTITLTVSKGPQPVDIPQDIIDMPKDDAIDALETLQLKVETTEVFDDAIAEGNVVSITPDIGTQVYWGDTVTLSISKGPETVTMPNVVGKSKDTAVSTLEALGFKVETQSSIYGTIFNNVIKQSQSANTQVPLRDADGNPTVIVLTLI